MQRDGRDFTVDVTPDGEGLVSHAGGVLPAQVADKTGLTRGAFAALSDDEGTPTAHGGAGRGRSDRA